MRTISFLQQIHSRLGWGTEHLTILRKDHVHINQSEATSGSRKRSEAGRSDSEFRPCHQLAVFSGITEPLTLVQDSSSGNEGKNKF